LNKVAFLDQIQYNRVQKSNDGGPAIDRTEKSKISAMLCFFFCYFFVRSTQRVKPKSQQKPTKGDLMMTRNDLGGGFGVFHIVPDQNSSRAACMALIEGEADHFD